MTFTSHCEKFFASNFLLLHSVTCHPHFIMPNTHRRRRRDETVLSRRRCVHEFAASSRRLPTDSIDNLETGQTDCVCVWLTTWILIVTDNFFNSDGIMTSLLKKLSIFIKLGVIKRYKVCLVSFKIVDQLTEHRFICFSFLTFGDWSQLPLAVGLHAFRCAFKPLVPSFNFHFNTVSHLKHLTRSIHSVMTSWSHGFWSAASS